MQLGRLIGRRFLILDSDDNVATLLDDEVEIKCLENGMLIEGDIPFGHKVSLHAISIGDAVMKYGVRIGVATNFIEKGEHIHVHNCK